MTIKLQNTSDKKLGVDVKINGMSLLFAAPDEAEKCRIWVIDPGKTYTLKGWYTEGDAKNVQPFKILVGDEAKQAKDKLGAKAGDIDIAVFESSDTPDDEDMAVSRGMRGNFNSAKTKSARATFATLHRAVQAGSKTKTTVVERGGLKRELIVRDEDAEKAETAKLKSVDFPNRKALGNISIRIPRIGSLFIVHLS